jgi:hypothetical protein
MRTGSQAGSGGNDPSGDNDPSGNHTGSAARASAGTFNRDSARSCTRCNKDFI